MPAHSGATGRQDFTPDFGNCTVCLHLVQKPFRHQEHKSVLPFQRMYEVNGDTTEELVFTYSVFAYSVFANSHTVRVVNY